MVNSLAACAQSKAVYVHLNPSLKALEYLSGFWLTVSEAAVLLCSPELLLISLQFPRTEGYPDMISKSPYKEVAPCPPCQSKHSYKGSRVTVMFKNFFLPYHAIVNMPPQHFLPPYNMSLLFYIMSLLFIWLAYRNNRKSLPWLSTYKSVRQQLNGQLKQNIKKIPKPRKNPNPNWKPCLFKTFQGTISLERSMPRIKILKKVYFSVGGLLKCYLQEIEGVIYMSIYILIYTYIYKYIYLYKRESYMCI